jgi:dinuclear metal center YbgI/SA1388 family protein
MPKTPPTLAEVLDILHEIAPAELAAEWDNTGLIVDPAGNAKARCARVLLTIDATADVVREAVRGRVDLLVAYHPPIFQPLRRLSAGDGKQAAVLQAVAAKLPIYSPHTALDAAPGGIADWLAEGVLGGGTAAVLRPCGDGDFGRVVELQQATSFAALLPRIRRHLGVRTLRAAFPGDRAPARVRTIAVAAGSGGAALRGERTDLWLTGEMSHHDVLAGIGAGTAVLLAEHSNTERGYLRVLRKRLRAAFAGEMNVAIAKTDRDPLRAL